MEMTFFNESFNPGLDSMCYDSGYVALRAEHERYKISLEVYGTVKVWFQGNCYRKFSTFPERLKEVFTKYSAKAVSFCPEIEIIDKNWYELVVRDLKGKFLFSDIIEIPKDFENGDGIRELIEELVDYADACADDFKH